MDALAALQVGLAPALASALLHSLWQVALLGVGAWAALGAVARATAALRHLIAMGFLVAMAGVPALTFLRVWRAPGAQLNAGWLPAVSAPELDAVAGAYVQASSPVAPLLASIWLAGVGLMLLRRFGGLRWVVALDRLPWEALPPALQARVDALQAALGIARRVTVRVSAQVTAPFTARLLRPVVWLPASIVTGLPREQLEALIAHELAHVARLDWLWNGLQCVIEALLFFHPAAWWLGRRIRIEREHACDDLAVAACGDAIALAEALAALECRRHALPPLMLAAHGGSLMQRIKRLLSTPPARSRWAARTGLAVLVASGVLLVSQAGISGDRPGIRIEATTTGELKAGDTREIRSRGIDGERYYRASKDAQGRLVEEYRVDGETRPVDEGVRRWVAEVVRVSEPPVPPPPPPAPAPPAPPEPLHARAAVAPPAPPPPPAPPAPPEPPSLLGSAPVRALLAQVTRDATVVARLGGPVRVADGEVRGSVELDGDTAPDGGADLRVPLAGSKARAVARVVATLEDGRWTVERIDLQ